MSSLVLALAIGMSGLASGPAIGPAFQPGPNFGTGPAFQPGPDPEADGPFQGSLEEGAAAFARAWTEKNASGLGSRLAETGIRLHLPDEGHLLIRPRQAQAALEKFLNHYVGGEALLSRVALAGDDGRKGFAEIRWETTSPGLSEAVTFTVFLGFALNDERWTVTEIRVLM